MASTSLKSLRKNTYNQKAAVTQEESECKIKILLTPREREILELIAYELTASEIASRLYLSIHTIQTHRKNMLAKLRVKNTAGMVRRGFEIGVLILNSNIKST